jgi:hypothetical protein
MEPTARNPFTAWFPDQAPEALQVLAFELVQKSLAEPSAPTVLGSALIITVGAASVTVTVTVCVAEPLGPLQRIANSVVFVSLSVTQRPLVARGPLQPPLAAQDVAFCAVQESTDLPP